MTTKTNILVLILTFISLIELRGQIPLIENQRGFKFRLSDYLDSIGFKKPDYKSIECDLRIWHDDFATGQIKLIRIIKTKNSSWSAFSLDFYCYNSQNCNLTNFLIDTLDLSDTWISTWKKILNNHLLNIENQEELNKRLKTPNGQVLLISDGSGYYFEIATKNAKRRFMYNNIQEYYDFYNQHGVNCDDYTKAIKLIRMIEKEFDWRFKVKP